MTKEASADHRLWLLDMSKVERLLREHRSTLGYIAQEVRCQEFLDQQRLPDAQYEWRWRLR